MQKVLVALALLAPVAAGSGCCSWNACGECGDTTDYCNSGESACEGNCKGTWCPSGAGSDDDHTSSDDDGSSAGSLYCPQSSDLNHEHGTVSFQDDGWAFTGDARVSSKTSWNLLGGYMEFDMDVSKVNNYVNTNFYTSSPAVSNVGSSTYCDIQKSSSGKASCMEMDIIENNGHCGMATTIHTFATDGSPNNGNCDRWGCATDKSLPSSTFTVKAAFGTDGSMTVSMDGVVNDNYSPSPSDASNAVVVQTMQSIGAVIESSQWYGWSPMGSSCPSGDKSGLDSSYVKISNVRVQGSVVQGPEPTLCSNVVAGHNATMASLTTNLRAQLRGGAQKWA